MNRTESNRANQLQFLRFIAFSFIFLWHANHWSSDYFPGGNGAAEAVSFFFILSGLVAGWSSYGKDITLTGRDVISYVWKRVKKVYPLYFVTTFFCIGSSEIPFCIANHLYVNIEDNLVQLLKNLLLIQSWFPNNYFSYNGVGWFLSSLMFLHLLKIPMTKMLNWLNQKRNRYFVFGIIFAILFIGIVFYCYAIQSYNTEFWAYVFPLSRLPEYAMGMIMGFVIRSLVKNIPEEKWVVVVFTGLEIVALYIWIYALFSPIIPWQYRIVHWLFPNLFLLVIFSFGKGFVSKLFSINALKFLGDISFECYLIHQLIIMTYSRISGVGNISTIGNCFSLLFCLVGTVLVARLISNNSK